MRRLRIFLCLLSVFLMAVWLAGCSQKAGLIEASLGKEFSLPIGQEAFIAEENLRVRFEDVTEDSRCPINVTCIWEGRASFLVQFTYGDTVHRKVLTEPGLTGRAEDVIGDYRVTFHLKPYPGEVEKILKEHYRLQMSISK